MTFDDECDGPRRGGRGGGGGGNRRGGKGGDRGGRRPCPDSTNGPYLGIVARINPDGGGFAFIESPVCKSWYGQDVYVYPRILEENNLDEGDAVGFFIHENEKGQPAVNAFKPIWRLLLKPKDGVVPPLGRYCGGVLNFTPKGHAYIYCPEVKHEFRKDVYVNEKIVSSNNLEEGMFVSFDLHINSSGMPQASSPIWLEVNKKDWQRPQIKRRRDDDEDGGSKKFKDDE